MKCLPCSGRGWISVIDETATAEDCFDPGVAMSTRPLSALLALALLPFFLTSCSRLDDDITLQGAGATFPAPLYKRWFLEFYRQHPEVRVNYQPIGSGAGIRQFTEGLVDFGASDAAMTDAEIAKIPEGVQLLPMTAGSIAVSYNLPSTVAQLRLSRKALVGILLGEITTWDDPAIVACNPGMNLPQNEITFVRRAESSGTTFAFTSHLAAISSEWKKGPGAGKTVVWPVGVGAKGNSGVAALIQQTPGSLGYVESGYAELTHLPMAAIENKAGEYVKPTGASAQAALAGAKLPDNLRVWVTDPDGPGAYPIVTYTWLLCRKNYQDPKVAEALKRVVRFGLTDGQKWSADLGYIPLPEAVAAKVLEAVDNIRP
jgi:phosphate transport system substrate-binding protein